MYTRYQRAYARYLHADISIPDSKMPDISGHTALYQISACQISACQITACLISAFWILPGMTGLPNSFTSPYYVIRVAGFQHAGYQHARHQHAGYRHDKYQNSR